MLNDMKLTKPKLEKFIDQCLNVVPETLKQNNKLNASIDKQEQPFEQLTQKWSNLKMNLKSTNYVIEFHMFNSNILNVTIAYKDCYPQT